MTIASTKRVSCQGGWWRHLNGYQWYVFILAGFEAQANFGRYATALFIIGWATGGLLFGVLGDKWGRAKTMAATIFVYAIFTGLSGLATSWLSFAFFRLLTGIGVGGEFAVGAI